MDSHLSILLTLLYVDIHVMNFRNKSCNEISKYNKYTRLFGAHVHLKTIKVTVLVLNFIFWIQFHLVLVLELYILNSILPVNSKVHFNPSTISLLIVITCPTWNVVMSRQLALGPLTI